MKLTLLVVLITIIVSPSSLVFSSEVQRPKETVILLHGLGRTYRSMKSLERYLKRKGYIVHNLKYPSTKKTVEQLSEEFFAPALEQYGKEAEVLHFVGHSLGGFLVRYYLRDNDIPNLGRLVMLAPPNKGCHVTDKLKNWFVYEGLLGPAGQQFGTEPDSLPNRLGKINAEVGVIAGNRSLNLFFSTLIPGPDDGKVSVECTKVDGMKDFLVLPVTHTYIMQNPVVQKQAEHFLRTGQFDHSKKR